MKRIETEEQYQAAMARIEELLPHVTENTPEDDERSIELVCLSNLVADYDDTHYPIQYIKSCLNCAKFTNYRSDLICGEINTPMPKEVDTRKGCDQWEEKGDTNWYLIPSEDGFVKKELMREEEDEIYKEFILGNNPCERMSEERLELAQHIKWRRVLENA